MQPSLIFALLALATFWQSSETQGGRGADGRFKALRYRDEAQGYLEASYNAQCIDESLAQAAWVSHFLPRLISTKKGHIIISFSPFSKFALTRSIRWNVPCHQ